MQDDIHVRKDRYIAKSYTHTHTHTLDNKHNNNQNLQRIMNNTITIPSNDQITIIHRNFHSIIPRIGFITFMFNKTLNVPIRTGEQGEYFIIDKFFTCIGIYVLGHAFGPRLFC